MDVLKLQADEIRRRRKMSVARLAELVGVGRVSIHRILTGETWPSRETYAGLARALGVAPWELIEGAPLTSIEPDELPARRPQSSAA